MKNLHQIKKVLSYIIILVLAMTACRKPQVGEMPDNGETADTMEIPNNGETTDSTETMVKKYLLKEYYAEEPNHPIRVIEWNEDFTKIMHITTQLNTYWQIDYSFEYCGNDNIRVVLSKPDDAHAMVSFTEFTCHLDEEGKISSIDYYFNSHYKVSTKYNYDESGKLVSVVDEAHNTGSRYVWEGDNVCEVYRIPTEELLLSFSGFTEHFHPDCTLPYLLEDGNSYAFWHLTQPLWKNWYNESPDMHYEYDEDGYITCSYRINEQGERTAITNYEYSQKQIRHK